MKKKIDDRLLIKILLKNAGLSYTEIASIFRVSEAAVRKRIKILEEEEIILGYRAFVDPTAARLCVSYTGVDVDPERLISVYNALKRFGEIEAVYITFGDHNLLVEIICDNMESLTKVHEKIERLEGVKRVCPAVVSSVWKKGMK